MLVKILGVIDLVVGLFLIFGTGLGVPSIFLIVFGIIFLIKSFMGGIPKEIAGLSDLSAGVILVLLVFFQVPQIICIISGIAVAQKGFFSFF